MDRLRVGTVAAVFRYLVKSMRGEAVNAADVTWNGVAGDRRYAFVRTGNTSHFPWLTARQVPALLQYTPYLTDPADPATGAVCVRTPDGTDLAIESEALRDELAARHRAPVHLLHLGRGAFDSAPLSVLSTATLAALSATAGYPLDVRRFRPNLLIAADEPEDCWQGGVLTFGDAPDRAVIRLDRPDQRCVMVTLDPDTSVSDPGVLKAVARRSPAVCAGMYGAVARIGSVHVGDPVFVAH